MAEEQLVNVVFQTTRAERAELRKRAAAEGVTMRTYIRRRTLLNPDIVDDPRGRPRTTSRDQRRLGEAS